MANGAIVVDVVIAEADDVVAPVDPADDGKVLARNSATGKYEHVAISGGSGAQTNEANTWTATQTFQPSGILGAETLENGGFDSDLLGWDLEGNDAYWGWDAGAAVRTLNDSWAEVRQDVTLTVPGWYKFEIVVSGMTAGSFEFYNDYGDFYANPTTSGTFFAIVYLTHENDVIYFSAYPEFDGRFESVSLRPLTLDSSLVVKDPNGNSLLEITPSAIEINGTLEINAENVIAPNLPTSDPGDNKVWLHNNQMTVGPISAVDHAQLANLDYASAEHTGFAGLDVPNTFTDIQTFNVAPVMPNIPAITRKNVFLDLNAYTAGLYVCDGSVVVNGDFESGDPPDDWTYDGSVTASATTDSLNGYQAALKLELSSDPTVGASQTFATDVDGVYIFSVWVKVITGQATIRFGPASSPGAWPNSLSSTNGSYVQLTGLFVASDTATVIELIGENSGDVVEFDDLIVAPARNLTTFAGQGDNNYFTGEQTFAGQVLFSDVVSFSGDVSATLPTAYDGGEPNRIWSNNGFLFVGDPASTPTSDPGPGGGIWLDGGFLRMS